MTSPARGVTLASLMTMGPARWSSAAESAARLGYGSIWVAETTGPEAFASLGALAPLAPGLGLGTGVLALQLRTPMLAAMGAATLQALHPERAVLLGIGISSPAVVDRWHGATYGTRPLAQVREYLTLVRQCWGGEPVDFDGDYYHCRRFRLGIRLGERRPRLVLGALNARMLAVAGELADGVLLNYLPASGVPWCVEQVRAAEAAAGRKPGACPVYAYVHVGVTDLDSARDAAQADLFSYAVVDSYAAAFRRTGFADEVDAIRSAHAARDRAAALAAVSDRMIQSIDIVGSAAEVSAAVTAYEAAGVDHAVVMPLPWGTDRDRVIADTLAAAAPGA